MTVVTENIITIQQFASYEKLNISGQQITHHKAVKYVCEFYKSKCCETECHNKSQEELSSRFVDEKSHHQRYDIVTVKGMETC